MASTNWYVETIQTATEELKGEGDTIHNSTCIDSNYKQHIQQTCGYFQYKGTTVCLKDKQRACEGRPA